MSEETLAAGVVVACVGESGPRYLLLRSARHQTWGVPKGHAEPGETALQAALRETREETGIVIDAPVSGFEESIEYIVDDRPKRVVYFLGTVATDAFSRSDEHDAAGWFKLEDALSRLAFPDMREVLRRAHGVLTRPAHD